MAEGGSGHVFVSARGLTVWLTLGLAVALATGVSATMPVPEDADDTVQDVQDAGGSLPLPQLADDSGDSPPAPPEVPPEGEDIPPAAIRTILGEAQRTVDTVLDLVPADPVDFIADSLEPINDAADDLSSYVLPEASAQQVEPPAPAYATATELAPNIPTGALVVGTAAAAAALVALWLAGSSAGTGGAASATASKFSTDLKRLLPFASPLFTRFEKDTVLGHPKREAIYALILQDPGISLQALCDATGLSRTAVTHHLRLLELQHLVVSKRMGRTRHYYENGGRFGRDQKDAYAVLQNPRSKAVAQYVRDHPGAIQKAICAALSIQPSIAHWHVDRLVQANLVASVRSGRTVSYFPATALHAVNALPPLAASPLIPA